MQYIATLSSSRSTPTCCGRLFHRLVPLVNSSDGCYTKDPPATREKCETKPKVLKILTTAAARGGENNVQSQFLARELANVCDECLPLGRPGTCPTGWAHFGCSGGVRKMKIATAQPQNTGRNACATGLSEVFRIVDDQTASSHKTLPGIDSCFTVTLAGASGQ
jgi:hypothetical protein